MMKTHLRNHLRESLKSYLSETTVDVHDITKLNTTQHSKGLQAEIEHAHCPLSSDTEHEDCWQVDSDEQRCDS